MTFRLLLCCFLFVSISGFCSRNATPQPTQAQPVGTQQSQPDKREQIHSQQIHNTLPGQITHQLATTSGDVHLHTTDVPPLIVQLDPRSTLWNLSCENDLVVMGKIDKGTSHPTVDQGYIYTDWDLVVEEIIKNNPKSLVQVGQTMVVTRPGGTLEVNGRHVYASREDFPQFQPGQEVLVYLRHLPEVGTYSLSSPNAFIFTGSKAVGLDKARFGQFGDMPKSELLDLSRKATTQKCNTGEQQ